MESISAWHHHDNTLKTYTSTMHTISKQLFALIACGLVSAAWAQTWGASDGAASMSYLTIAQTPRQAALAGSGLASGPVSEAAWNPMAGAWSDAPSISGSQARLTSILGARWNTIQFVQPFASVHVLVGANFLNTDPYTSRDEDGFTTGTFSANAWNARLGLSSGQGQHLTWGVQSTYSHFTIESYDAQAALFDAVLGYRLGSSLRLAIGAFHYGWMSSFDTASETTPFTLQAGVSYQLWQKGNFAWEAHADVRHQTDASKEYLLGLETTYSKALVLRLGTNLSAEQIAPSAGVALTLHGLEVSYGYAANDVCALKGNHHFGLGYLF